MQQPDAQVSANNLCMFVRKGCALIGVEFIGDPATLNCLLERLMESIALGS